MTEELLPAFLALCRKYCVTLKAPKTKLGYRSGTDGKSICEDNIAPIVHMDVPVDVSSLRRTLGLFVGSKNFVQDYAIKI